MAPFVGNAAVARSSRELSLLRLLPAIAVVSVKILVTGEWMGENGSATETYTNAHQPKQPGVHARLASLLSTCYLRSSL
eukprot:834802-Amphidinium_carterae.1